MGFSFNISSTPSNTGSSVPPVLSTLLFNTSPNLELVVWRNAQVVDTLLFKTSSTLERGCKNVCRVVDTLWFKTSSTQEASIGSKSSRSKEKMVKKLGKKLYLQYSVPVFSNSKYQYFSSLLINHIESLYGIISALPNSLYSCLNTTCFNLSVTLILFLI